MFTCIYINTYIRRTKRVHAVSLVAMLGLSAAHVCIDLHITCLYTHMHTNIYMCTSNV